MKGTMAKEKFLMNQILLGKNKVKFLISLKDLGFFQIVSILKLG